MKKTMHVLLWVAQFLLGITLIWAASLKLFQPIEQLKTMWPWTGEIAPALVRSTGVIDLLGALGVLLPSLFRFKPLLASIAAFGIVLLMISASVFHVFRGETPQIGFNIIFGLIAGFVAYGRWKLAPIPSK
ncbi:DoxX family protein [Fluviicola chungangensis]|uniref:DoxX family protein n=1 Tax=Fluviicola chungangensis TaxID=2597671 RepID=A0A556N0X6_9FLAO|nr:DoxX family protein [Fluviicola chungangensis]TSJ45840.1 DoxX family protein [Fluviicola chungangensis]